MDVLSGTVVCYSDIGCPWASLTVHRMRERRDALGLDIVLDHRAFPLELINEQPTPKRIVDAEVAVLGAHEPNLRWRPWRQPDWNYPGSTLLALAAVQAAKAQGLAASEDLDAALRHAFYAEGRPIGIFATVLAVAAEVDSVDVKALEGALRHGIGTADVFHQWDVAEGASVQGSPHLFLPDGSDVHNPGITFAWTREAGSGFPRISADDPAAIDDVLRRAVGAMPPRVT